MGLFRTIYTSQPFGYDSSILSSILIEARKANARDDITGALICRADVYMQWLEGPEDKVRATIERISRDDRHLEVRVHVSEEAKARVFGAWAMLHDPAHSWIWTQDEIADGALDRATPQEVTDFFLSLDGAVQPA